MWEWVVPALLGLVGALVGALIAPLVVARIEYRAKQREILEQASASVLKAQASRWIAAGLEGIEWLPDDEKSAIGIEARKQAVLEFIEATNAARHALAEVVVRNNLASWKPSDGWEITDEVATKTLEELNQLLAKY